MPLKLAEPPRQATEAVRSALEERARSGRFITLGLQRSDLDELSMAAPHQIFTLTLQDLAGGGDLSAAIPSGWRYLVNRGNTVVAAAETGTEVSQASPSLVFNEGPYVGATAEAIINVEEAPQLERSEYLLSLLRIPGLYVIALWLRPEGDVGDLVVPIGQTHPVLEPGRVYDGSEFVASLVEPATEQLSFDSSPREQNVRGH